MIIEGIILFILNGYVFTLYIKLMPLSYSLRSLDNSNIPNKKKGFHHILFLFIVQMFISETKKITQYKSMSIILEKNIHY